MAVTGQDQLETPPDLNALAKNIVDSLVSVKNIERIWAGSEPTLVKVVEIALGTLIGLIGSLGAEFAKAIVNAEDIAEPAFRRLVNVALQDITGVDANISNSGGGRGGRTGAARNIGAGILQALSGIGNTAAPPGGQLQPSTRAAEDYLTFVVQMGMEGWLTGLMGEMMTLGQVESLGDLDDTLANSLGLARTSRAVMRPFINTTVALPAQWQMNKLYRPELLSPSLAVKLFNRKIWTRAQLNEELARQGFTDDRMEALIQDAEKKPSLAQVLRAYDLEYVPIDDVRAFLEDDGYPARYVDFIVQLVEVEKIGKFHEDLADAAAAAYVAHRIPPARFNQLLAESGLPTRTAARIRELAELKRAVNKKPLNESDAEEAAKRSLISIPEYREILRAAGYDEQAVMVKELLLQSDINSARQADDAKARREAAAAADKERKRVEAEERRRLLELERAITEPSIGMVERFVTRGHWSFQQYAEFLRTEKYDAVTIAALLADAEQARMEYLDRQAERKEAELRAATRTIGLAALEQAVLRGHATMAEYQQRLAADKYTAADRAKLVANLQDRLDDQAELEERRRQAEARRDDKGVSVAQFEQAVLRGIATLQDFAAFLAGDGYPPFDRSVILQLTERKLADQAAAIARREQLEAAAAAARVPVADIRRAVIAGLRSIDNYRNALISARVPADDRLLLEELLQQELAERQRAIELRAQIEAARLVRGLSLSDLERAVVIGAATVEQYQQQLAGEHFTPDAIATLTALILDRIRETQRARRRREEIDNADRSKKVTPAQMAAAVRAGIRTTSDYLNTLIVNGNNEEDAALLTQLLELELEEAAAARARREQIAAELAIKQISLSDLAKAVRAGERTLEQYAQRLRDEGYLPIDVTTQVALLERELATAAAGAETRAAVVAGDADRELSLSQFERAVLADIRSIDEYAQFVESLGYTLDAQATLAALLQQQLDKNAGAEPASS